MSDPVKAFQQALRTAGRADPFSIMSPKVKKDLVAFSMSYLGDKYEYSVAHSYSERLAKAVESAIRKSPEVKKLIQDIEHQSDEYEDSDTWSGPSYT